MKPREQLLSSIAFTIVALVSIADALGMHLHSKGSPGWYEYAMAAGWTGLALWSWRSVVKSPPPKSQRGSIIIVEDAHRLINSYVLQ